MTPAEHLKNNFSKHRADLDKLVKIPSISFEGFDPGTVDQSADAVAELLKKRGLDNVEILRYKGAKPYVYGEKITSPDKPTILLYAHHDVQPIGRQDIWKTEPFVPTEKEGPGGLRLYGRGTADDKAGIIIHTAAIASYLETDTDLPVNIKVLIEGEEEIGSPFLLEFLKAHGEKLKTDALVLTDTANYDCGVPALTVALRGMVALDVEVRALNKTIHSGFWGGLVPDPAMALSKMIQGLVDENGRVAIPEIIEHVPHIPEEQQKLFQQLPFDDDKFRDQSGMLPQSQILKHAELPITQLWQHPSVTINGIQSSSRAQAGNTINDTAWCRLSMRLAPGMKASFVREHIEKYLKQNLPWNLKLDIHVETEAEGWQSDPTGPHQPAYQAACRALEKGFDHPCLYHGCGASIPFVQFFVRSFSDLPALLIGIEDPYTNAHGENESLLLSDFQKACLSEVYLFQELADTLKT